MCSLSICVSEAFTVSQQAMNTCLPLSFNNSYNEQFKHNTIPTDPAYTAVYVCVF